MSLFFAAKFFPFSKARSTKNGSREKDPCRGPHSDPRVTEHCVVLDNPKPVKLGVGSREA